MSCEECFENVLPYTRAAPKMARLTKFHLTKISEPVLYKLRLGSVVR